MTGSNSHWVDSQERAEMVLHYCKQLIYSLGPIGIETAKKYPLPGNRIRQHPLESTVLDDSSVAPVSGDRYITDVRDYSGSTHPVAAHDDVQYMTVRRRKKTISGEIPDTIAVGWPSIPEPRKLRLAEHLSRIDESDIPRRRCPDHLSAAHTILQHTFPKPRGHDDSGFWVHYKDTSLNAKTALRNRVTALQYGEEDCLGDFIRFRDDYADSEEIEYRLSTGTLLVEKYSDATSNPHNSESEYSVFSKGNAQKEQMIEREAVVNGIGSVVLPTPGDRDCPVTNLLVIPEMQRPECILSGLPAPNPLEPPKESPPGAHFLGYNTN